MTQPLFTDPPPGPRERRLAKRGKTPTTTDVERAHARHADQCGICQDSERGFRAAMGSYQRSEEARRTFVQGLMRPPTKDALSDPGYVRRLLAAAGREWRRSSPTQAMEADARRVEVLAAQHEADMADTAARRLAARLRAVGFGPDGLKCSNCGVIFFGTRVIDIVHAARLAWQHRCEQPRLTRQKGTPQ
jgi:hypothetical protein